MVTNAIMDHDSLIVEIIRFDARSYAHSEAHSGDGHANWIEQLIYDQ